MFKYLIIGLLFPSAALACQADLGGKFRAPLNVQSPNQALFSEAVRRLANSERCRRGLSSLKPSDSLLNAAHGHSQDMVDNQFFAHKSPTRGRISLKDRLSRANVPYRLAAENISQMSVYNFQGQRFIIKDAAACNFQNAATRKPIEKHSYASLAQAVMTGWMNSPGHRRNIINPDLGAVGSAVAIDQRAPHCGHTLMTQNFSDG